VDEEARRIVSAVHKEQDDPALGLQSRQKRIRAFREFVSEVLNTELIDEDDRPKDLTMSERPRGKGKNKGRGGAQHSISSYSQGVAAVVVGDFGSFNVTEEHLCRVSPTTPGIYDEIAKELDREDKCEKFALSTEITAALKQISVGPKGLSELFSVVKSRHALSLVLTEMLMYALKMNVVRRLSREYRGETDRIQHEYNEQVLKYLNIIAGSWLPEGPAYNIEQEYWTKQAREDIIRCTKLFSSVNEGPKKFAASLAEALGEKEGAEQRDLRDLILRNQLLESFKTHFHVRLTPAAMKEMIQYTLKKVTMQHLSECRIPGLFVDAVNPQKKVSSEHLSVLSTFEGKDALYDLSVSSSQSRVGASLQMPVKIVYLDHVLESTATASMAAAAEILEARNLAIINGGGADAVTLPHGNVAGIATLSVIRPNFDLV